jgi:hypothetical protein
VLLSVAFVGRTGAWANSFIQQEKHSANTKMRFFFM